MNPIKSMTCVELDTGEKLFFHKSVNLPPDWSEGMTFDRESFMKQVLLLQYPRAIAKAVSLLAIRDRSEGEIRKKLLFDRYSDETVDMVLVKLHKEKLIDDQSFSIHWTESCAGQKIGPTRISRDLRLKGVAEKDIATALEQYDEDAQLEQASAFVRKKLRSIGPYSGESVEMKSRIIQMLIRRGFHYETARNAVETVFSEIEK